jgi:hypothetical protein
MLKTPFRNLWHGQDSEWLIPKAISGGMTFK